MNLIRVRTRMRVPLVAALGLFCAASIAVLLVVDLYVRYHDDIADAKRAVSNYSDILAEHTASTFRSINDKLRSVEEIRGLSNHASFTAIQTASELKKLTIGSQISVAYGWTDASRNLLAHSYDGDPPRRNISDMAHFIAQRDGPDADMFIAPPFRSSVGNKWFSAVSRRLSNDDGSFAGVLTAPIDQSYFKELFKTIDLGNGGSVLLLHRSGQILVREPTIERAIGRSFADSPLLSQYLPKASSGAYETTSAVDGVARIAGYSAVPGFPLVLLVSLSRADVLARWYAHLYVFGPLAFVFIVTILFGSSRLARQSEDLKLAQEILSESEQRAQAHSETLRITLAHISQGLSLFDADGRLAAWNDRYIELYGIPADLTRPGITFSELADYHEQSGLIVDLDRSQIGSADISSTQLQFKDGRRINITRKHLQGGGWVATHDDVTEYVRAETELFEQATELARVNMRFEAALNNMSQGLCVFDADKTLVISNPRFREIYNLTAEQVVPGTPLRKMLRAHTDNGGSGELSVETQSKQMPVKAVEEFVLADGRVTLIRRKTMSDGGWVATYEDVTERKRSERLLAEKAAQLQASIFHMPQGLAMFDKDRRLVVCNELYGRMYKLPPELLLPGTPYVDIVAHRTQNQILKERQGGIELKMYVPALLAMPTGQRQTRIDEHTDGSLVQVVREPMAGGGWVSTHEDVTEQRRLEQELDRNRTFLHQIIEHIPTQITVKDARDRRYVLLNRVAEQALGPSGDVVGKTANEIFSKSAAEKIAKDDDAALQSESGVFLDEHEFEIRKGAARRFITTKRVSIRGENGDPAYLINLVEDVTERKRANDQIAFLAHHDQLTGLHNRARFAEKLDEAAKRCARHGTPFTVLMLDLDKFKYVNDTLGHPAGDELLIQVAQRLASSLRDTDVLARLGGDEFAIIQEGESNQRDGAIAMALRLIDILAEAFDLNGSQANIGTSIGIAFAPECGLDPEGLMKKADLALYEAKSGGRNDYRLFEPQMAEISNTQKVLESELRDAIQRDEFEMHYQPVVDAKTGSICAAEALVRWRHPTRGLVPPDQFIPLAESTGLMIPLGEWVLQQVCHDAASWPPHVKVAINISAVQFNSGNLFDVVLCALVESGMPPERLELEITETMLLKNEHTCLLTIRQLKNIGISIALDDFGIGYSSSSYLTRVPFDKIKIDKSFVQGFPDRRECAAIVQSVIALARALDMTITAEGVETRAQFEALQAVGVEFIQGYLFGRPVPLQRLDWSGTNLQAKIVA